jgi:predicted alpha/beta superfamily hydrolase
LPEALIVGIAYGSFDPAINRRDVDFTAPATDAVGGEGGAQAFQSFLKEELLPEIDRRYRTRPDRRVLFGQSRGGSFVLYSAFTEPDLFWGRIASNPAFSPGRTLFFGEPARGRRSDLHLIVASGSRDRPQLREAALQWFAHWSNRPGAPWALRTITIEGGTHSANSSDAYRAGMLTLFPRP